MSTDEKWMRRALALARRGEGRVSPNPMVGAVVVKDGRLIAQSWHRAYGQAHAEADALRQAGSRARGATLYVTLEPCTHWGKTPPCVEAVLRSGVERVVVAMRDPNPRAAGGLAKLRRAGIQTISGLLQAPARRLNKTFLSAIRLKRPYVILKAAASLDGRLATVTGESKWITGEAARAEGHRLRARVDAVAVGTGTVLRDNPSLTAHGRGRNPVRVLFAGKRALPPKAKIFNSEAPTWVLKKALGPAGLRRALADLSKRGISHLLVEGGARLQRSFLEAGVVDEIVWFIAPLLIGPAKRLKDALRFPQAELRRIGKDWQFRAYVHRPR